MDSEYSVWVSSLDAVRCKECRRKSGETERAARVFLADVFPSYELRYHVQIH
jgi:hypothetical protein